MIYITKQLSPCQCSACPACLNYLNQGNVDESDDSQSPCHSCEYRPNIGPKQSRMHLCAPGGCALMLTTTRPVNRLISLKILLEPALDRDQANQAYMWVFNIALAHSTISAFNVKLFGLNNACLLIIRLSLETKPLVDIDVIHSALHLTLEIHKV